MACIVITVTHKQLHSFREVIYGNTKHRKQVPDLRGCYYPSVADIKAAFPNHFGYCVQWEFC